MLTAMPGRPTLTMTGGTLNISGGYVWWGDGPDSFPIWYMEDGEGDIGLKHELGWEGGGGTMIMTGGTVESGELLVPESSGAYGELYLYDGTYSTGVLNVKSNGLIDIHEGTLEVTGGGFVQMRTPGALSTASTGTVVNENCTVNLYGDGTTVYSLADFHISGFGAGFLL